MASRTLMNENSTTRFNNESTSSSSISHYDKYYDNIYMDVSVLVSIHLIVRAILQAVPQIAPRRLSDVGEVDSSSGQVGAKRSSRGHRYISTASCPIALQPNDSNSLVAYPDYATL